jgi:hypothetical protein
MPVLWPTFVWSAGIGLPAFAILCYAWRSKLRVSSGRRFIAVLVLAVALSPNFVVPHEAVAAYSAISLSGRAVKDPFLWYFVAAPIIGVSAVVFLAWTAWFKLTSRGQNA